MRKAIRGHSTIVLLGERAYCARRQCARFRSPEYIELLLGLVRVVYTRWLKETTAKRYQNKNRYDMPRGRAPGEAACRLQIESLARSLARSLSPIAREPSKRERSVTRLSAKLVG